MEVNAFLVNAFTANGRGGNPAGVVLNADNLSDQDKLNIAQAVGFSETAFICQDEEVDFAVSFFTVTDEVDFCGHATLATFSTLYQQGLISEGRYIQRTKAGLLGVTVASDGQIVMEQALPDYLGVVEYQTIAEMIGLDAELLASTQLPVEIISTGLPDIIVPVPFGYLDKLQVNNSLLSGYCKQHNLVGIHAFELCDKDSGLTASCRNFAPLFGIPEESATGSANGALACYLTKHLGEKLGKAFTFEQGRAMGCVSSITASVASNEQGIVKVSVGGFAREIGQQTVCL